MKLTNKIKEKIDNFFDNISAEDLYNISVQEYGFVEVAKESPIYVSCDISEIEKMDLSSLISKSDKQILQFNHLAGIKFDIKFDDFTSSFFSKVECKPIESKKSDNYSNDDPTTPLAA